MKSGRRGLAGARDVEFIIEYVDGFLGVYVKPWVKEEGETWYVWFILPGKGKAARLVNELWPGVYADHEGNVIEYDPDWTLILGTVTRKGDQPLVSPEMFK